jgi:hypothetical protein
MIERGDLVRDADGNLWFALNVQNGRVDLISKHDNWDTFLDYTNARSDDEVSWIKKEYNHWNTQANLVSAYRTDEDQ